jgi:hypothetical protein
VQRGSNLTNANTHPPPVDLLTDTVGRGRSFATNEAVPTRGSANVVGNRVGGSTRRKIITAGFWGWRFKSMTCELQLETPFHRRMRPAIAVNHWRCIYSEFCEASTKPRTAPSEVLFNMLGSNSRYGGKSP